MEIEDVMEWIQLADDDFDSAKLVNNHHQRWWLEWIDPYNGPKIPSSFYRSPLSVYFMLKLVSATLLHEIIS